MTLRGWGKWSAQAWELMFFNSHIGFVCGILQWLLGEGVSGLHRREGEGQAWELVFFNSTLMYEIDSIKLYFTL